MKLQKALIILGVLMFQISPLSAQLKAGHPFKRSEEISVSVNRFLTDWLVKRDVERAMLYVAANPLLSSKCNLPPGLSTVPKSPGKRRNIIDLTLTEAIKVFPKYKSLDSAIMPSDIAASDWLDIETKGIYDILRIKPGQKGYLMCKLDESSEYRKALQRPDVYYVSFRIKDTESVVAEWITAWIKKGQEWRLIAIALTDD